MSGRAGNGRSQGQHARTQTAAAAKAEGKPHESKRTERSQRGGTTVRLRKSRHARIPARQLEPHPLNFRIHTERQKSALSAILQEVGFVGALLVRPLRRDRYQVLDGHERLTRFRPDEPVPCLVVELSDDEARKVLATFDQIGALAEIDQQLLQELKRSITFETAELDALIDNALASARIVEREGNREMDPDAVPAPPDKPMTRRGDVWILGEHRLMCGDSSLPEDLDRLLDGAAIHLVNMDPPYNVKVEPRSNNAIAAGLSSFQGTTHHQKLDVARHPGKTKATQKKLRAKDRPLANDFVSDAEFDRLLLAWFGNAARVLVPGGTFYIWGGYANAANYPPALKATGLYFSQAIIWVKEHPVLTRKDFMGNHEWCFYGWKEGAAHRFFGPANIPDTWELEPDAAVGKSIDLGEGVSLRDSAGGGAITVRPSADAAVYNVVAGAPVWIRCGASDVWRVKKITPQKMVHLTEKPVELAERAIRYSSRSDEHVLDLFGGSGSTLIGCQRTRRRAFLMELDPLYCDVIVRRFEEFTGTKAERIAAGPPANKRKAA
jgi:DNA modification methylase